MNKEEARYYLESSGFSEEQINTIEQAFKPEPTDDATLRDIFCIGCEYKEQVPCSDAIGRAEAIKIASGYCHPANVAKELAKLPSVTPQPKIGRWIAYEVRLPDRTILNYRCSVCGRKLIGYATETLSEAPFCHCGARMVEPQERSDKE